VRVDVDDHHLVIFALPRLLCRMGEELRRVELVHRHPSSAIGNEVHDPSPIFRIAVPSPARLPSPPAPQATT
jgi:hypothetical protein